MVRHISAVLALLVLIGHGGDIHADPATPPQASTGTGIPHEAREVVKSVMDKVVETARTSCPTGEGNDGLTELRIIIEPNGRVQRVEIANATSSEQTAKCIAGIAQMATFPPHGRPEPLSIVYPVILGDPAKIPDLMKSEVDNMMGWITTTVGKSCPTGEGNDGTVTLEITLDHWGAVQKVLFVKSTASEAATKCLIGITQMAKFPVLRRSAFLVFNQEVMIAAPPEGAVVPAPVSAPTVSAPVVGPAPAKVYPTVPAPSEAEGNWSGGGSGRSEDRSKRISGIILAGAVGPAFIVVGGGVFAGLFAVGKGKENGCNITDEYTSVRDSEACEEEGRPYIVASAVVAGVMGFTGLIFIFAGAAMAQNAGDRMRKNSVHGTNERRGMRLELVGFAPLTDRDSRPSGLAMQWAF